MKTSPREMATEAKDRGSSVRVVFGHSIELRRIRLGWLLSSMPMDRHDALNLAPIPHQDANSASVFAGMVANEIGMPWEHLSSISGLPGEFQIAWRVAL